ncbi:ELMO/CED-12 family protein [Hirsutella rhossiliensis]|uniref:ELMO/CED-12 family domain-containing protein n=1 Tax=Hirsutella rhossiliensis TaxID=111463 RepID=A0A9P8SJK8_9HYPO|nr:ELMO/CED-12 family domain-containing protein [Hirsutella rhossiliensis]KAH0963141.1 ELMO/CED-12 family domain-containing protein [Hirsutella rhossiliensis]
MAVFKLQTSINDPAFADVFISAGGLAVLRRLIMGSGGNTLAYALQSLTRLLEVDMGWEIFEGPTATDLVERAVELIVTNPLVNILRGAMSILVALVGHSESDAIGKALCSSPGTFGFRALKPAVAVYPQFFELVIQQLQSADHALCANALMLINALIRDALSTSAAEAKGSEEWVKLVKRLQDLGVVQTAYKLMQSSALHDLALPILEFQSLSKVLIRNWREVKVDLERQDHRRALKGIHLASAPDRASVNGGPKEEQAETGKKDSRKHNPEKWRRLGFETESPAQEFDATGCLGMMDLAEYVRKHEDGFQKLLLEQASRPVLERCPVARASLAVTTILYEHFEIDKADLEDIKGYQGAEVKDQDELFRPLLLQWSRLHTAGLLGFFRIWKATGAEQDDFDKVAELVRILVAQVVGQASRTRNLLEVEDEILEYDIDRLREAQMELLELAFEDTWGQHLHQVREVLQQEALQFVKEQRVRCLLQGSWFTKPASQQREGGEGATQAQPVATRWRFAKLSHNRRHLHYADFEEEMAQDPGLDSLTERVDLSTISSVVSNVSVPHDDAKSTASGSTLQKAAAGSGPKATTKITIYSYADGGGEGAGKRECPILTLWPVSQSLASEWLDGLLMLLSQAPITAETSKLINLVSGYGLKMRLLNVRMDSAFDGPPPGAGVVPSRAGLDEDYFFEV